MDAPVDIFHVTLLSKEGGGRGGGMVGIEEKGGRRELGGNICKTELNQHGFIKKSPFTAIP